MIEISEFYEIEDGEEYEILHRYLSYEDILEFSKQYRFYNSKGQKITKIKRDFNKLCIIFGDEGFISFDVHPRVVRW